jgi:hypothetical protein
MIAKWFTHVFFALSLLGCAPLQAIILEAYDIHEILKHVYDTHHYHDILVCLDIDNTIGEFKDGFGGDEWFSAKMKERMIFGISADIAVAELLPLYFEIQKTIWLEPVQECTPKLIHFLQDIGIAVMALTSRSFTILDRTIEMLHHMDIDFSRSALHAEPIDLTLRDVGHYRNGVISCGQNDKGELLVKFFGIIGYQPKKVIFVDDKLKYVEQVDRAMEKAGIPCISIRYSHLDAKVANYNIADHDARLKQFCLEHLEPGSLVIS